MGRFVGQIIVPDTGDVLVSAFSYLRRRRLAGKRAVRLSDDGIKELTGGRKHIKRKYYA
jgi:hypothetical protein